MKRALHVVAVVSQKGGVAKSTIARAVAVEAARDSLDVMIADLDLQQQTSAEWGEIRQSREVQPVINSILPIANVAMAIQAAEDAKVDLLVIDGPARASSGTLDIANLADLVIMPTCASRDDLAPALKLAYELEGKGISKTKIVFALVRVFTESEINVARATIEEAGFVVLNGFLPEKVSYRLAQNVGKSITETSHRTLNKKAGALLDDVFLHLIENRE